MAATGRPSAYTPELAEIICNELANRKGLDKICEQDDRLPHSRTVRRWIRENEEFRQMYAYAKDDCAESCIEGLIDIADDMTIEPDHKRIMVDVRKFAAIKLLPKKYGDKLQQDIDATLRITINDPSKPE